MSVSPARPTGAQSPAQLLSNGHYTVMVNAAGSGYSQWRGLAVTRWREDPVGDGWGSYLLLRDEENGDTWSPSRQPYGSSDDSCGTTLGDDRVSLSCQHGSLLARLDVAVAGDRDLEWRRVTLTNQGERERTLSLTSYAELVLGPGGADAAHPAFSKMFVETEWVEQGAILLATRRRRSPSEPEVWAAHRAVVDGQDDDCEYESDRMQFLGRTRSLRNAQAMQPGAVLSQSQGCVLDPIFSVRRRVTIAAGASVHVTVLTALASSRDDALALIRSLDNQPHESVLAGSKAYADAEHARLDISADQASRFSALTGPLLYADTTYRPSAALPGLGVGGPPVLWRCGISGDRPIVLLRIGHATDIDCAHELFLAQRYWQARQLGVDVVLQDLSADDALHGILAQLTNAQNDRLKANTEAAAAQAFTLRDSELADEVRAGLATAARVVLEASAGFPDATAWHRRWDSPASGRIVKHALESTRGASIHVPSPSAGSGKEFDNGLGGFSSAGRSYTICSRIDRHSPMPWVNVIANPNFGFLVSAEGGGYCWSTNSQQNPLTPWPNDPVSDTPCDVLYLRDEDSGQTWSATAAPMPVSEATYTTEHAKGYSRFTHDAHGIAVDLLQFVPSNDSIKLSRLCLHNGSGRRRRLAITAYVQWAMGANGSVSAPFVTTSRDHATGALFARNTWRAEFHDRVAFLDLGGLQQSMTGDRLEFLGRYGAVDQPLALADSLPLSGQVGAGLAPCGALQATIELAPGERVDIRCLLGEATSITEAQALVQTYRAADLDTVLRDACSPWDELLDTVQVSTPDRAMDIVLNDWLLYQTLGCRMWARTAYYQASGAYGFRDQLQDAMALCVARPDLAREHLLRAASRQFVQGDVQHWWLPPSGQGVRTRISDDRIWLAYVAAHYIRTTADKAVLDEVVPFLDGAAIKAGDADAFYQPGLANECGSLYEHAARAIDSSLTLGAHGLPLMGTGDWNDGMNNVGAQGRGESLWLAWFLLSAIDNFLPYARDRGEQARIDSWQAYASALRTVIETSTGWDGQWYRRGYYDDGTPLGSSQSEECKIDVIAQSWSVIAGADPAHAAQAMKSVEKYLIRHEERIALLFTPPFDRTPLNPGYIKGYPAGIRENGGQYTHGATWSIFAYALLGQGDQAAELFNMLNPIRHSDTSQAVARYQVEPYVACADVYSVSPLVGRGGWTWYTGSAGWLYRAGLEAILGFQRLGEYLRFNPCIPRSWPRFELVYRHRGKQHRLTRYVVAVENPTGVNGGVISVELDGALLDTDRIPLMDDGQEHRVRITLGQ